MTGDIQQRARRRLLADAPGAVTPARAAAAVRAEGPLLADEDVRRLAASLVDGAGGAGFLDALLADPAVTDVLVNAGPVWVERAGDLERLPFDVDHDDVVRAIERVIGPLGLRLDRGSPVVDARLPDGSRLSAVIPPVAVDGPCLAVRRFADDPVALSGFAAPPVAALLATAVGERRNIVISGGTGSGKTTLLAALLDTVGAAERIVTIEDAAELRLRGANVVRLEGRLPNAEGAGEVSVRALLRAALRLRPNRIVVGEVRDSAALDMVQAMNTGHPGSLSTCHANGPADALRRLETMVLMGDVGLSAAAVREQIVAAVDLVVHVTRAAGGRRHVAEVAEVVGHGSSGWGVATIADGAAVLGEPRRPPRIA